MKRGNCWTGEVDHLLLSRECAVQSAETPGMSKGDLVHLIGCVRRCSFPCCSLLMDRVKWPAQTSTGLRGG